VEKLGGRSLTASSSQADDLLVVGSVRRIIGGLYFQEPFQAGGVDLCGPILPLSLFLSLLFLKPPLLTPLLQLNQEETKARHTPGFRL
jgi:hypothetical protein